MNESAINPYMLWLKEQKSADLERDFQAQVADYQASYHAASVSRFLPMPGGIKVTGSDGDYHYQTEQAFFLMMERARSEDRDNMVFGQGVNRLVSNVLPAGFSHDSLAPDDDLADDLHEGWINYSTDKRIFDYSGERDIDAMAELAFRNKIIDGDISHLILEDGRVQTMEGHKLRTPWSKLGQRSRISRTALEQSIVHGVELKDSRRVAYYYTGSELSALTNVRYNINRVEPYNAGGVQQVLHVYNPKRFTQRRGVTAIAPIVYPTKYHDDLQFAALVNAKRQSFIATIHEFDLGVEDEDLQDADTVRPYIAGVTGQGFEGGTPGTRVKGIPGEKIKPWTTNVPSHSHFQHAELLMSIMSINLDMPMMVFLLDTTKGNFNAYRGVMQQVYRRCRYFQRLLRTQFHSPLYLHYCWRRIRSEAAMRSAYRRHGDLMLKHLFTPPKYEYIQPLQDAQADDMRLSKNLISHRQYCLENSPVDWWTLADEITEDRATLIEASMKQTKRLNDKYPEMQVNWREIAYGPPRSGTNISMSGVMPDADPNAQSEDEDQG